MELDGGMPMGGGEDGNASGCGGLLVRRSGHDVGEGMRG